jgi:hypothetical protein
VPPRLTRESTFFWVDNDGEHPVRTREGKARLAKGTHKVVVTYFQAIGPADLAVEIQAPRLGRHNLGDLVAPSEADLDTTARATPR